MSLLFGKHDTTRPGCPPISANLRTNASPYRSLTRSNGRKNTSYVWETARELTAREVELFEGTDRIRPVDFHSNRRAFATGLRHAKVDARDAMRLAAHTSYETHQKYVLETGPIPAPPAAALPKLPVDVLPILRSATRRSQSVGSVQKILNDSVGVSGFEPPTTCTQSRSSTRLRYTPEHAACPRRW